MKQSMMIALSDYQLRISQEVERQLQAMVENFPFEGTVRSAVSKAIDETINEYFEAGPGRDVIKEAVYQSFDMIFAKGADDAKTGE